MNHWWTDDRINSTVTRDYICAKLGSKKQQLLHRPLAFGDSLTDDTYLDWILVRGKRLFLIFDDIGIPEWIFEAVDRSFDDEDLPLSADALWELKLSPGRTDGLDKRFLRRQYYYLLRNLEQGAHIDYAEHEVVPLEPLAKKQNVSLGPNTDRVSMNGKRYTRKKIPLDGDGENGVDKVLFEMHLKTLQKLKHPHLVSLWATYTQSDYGFILLTPSEEMTLKDFLEEQPKSFKQLLKEEKREILISWVHCLTDAVAYLHQRSYAHQRILPSNIFIDAQYNINLGEFAAFDILDERGSAYGREIYEYAAPEQWRRKPTLQQTAPLKATLHGGGRTVRRLTDGPPRTKPLISGATATANFFRRSKSARSSVEDHPPSSSRATCTTSSSSSSSNKSLSLPKRTIITTFTSSTPTPTSHFSADIFSLCTISLQLLSALFSSQKYNAKSFTHYRSKHNRQAGRGGAPADASFHANMGQVEKWIEMLEKEAWSRDDPIFRALAGIMGVVRGGLNREPDDRWRAREGEERMREILDRFVHWRDCCGGYGDDDEDIRGYLVDRPEDSIRGSSAWMNTPRSGTPCDTPISPEMSRRYDWLTTASGMSAQGDSVHAYKEENWPLGA
ncbi:hypothetical protein MMC20_002640 [Loxospora ochrophaea]|nr:hypothetical protein [Loxospora ochrophaea]